MKIRDVLQSKPNSTVCAIRPDATVKDAISELCKNGIGSLLVLNENEEPVGIISERDYARKVTLKGKTAAATPVSEIMTKNVICVEPSQPIEECMALMVGKNIRHLPVLEEGKLAGIISIGDVVKTMLQEQQTLIEHLESYIRGY